MRRALASLLLLPFLAACGGDVAPTATPIVLVVTATPVPPTVAPSAPPATPSPRPTLTPPPPTRAPIPTETPRPTIPPTPETHFGTTIHIDYWDMSIPKMEARNTIIWSDYGNGYDPSGKFWIVYLDAKNTQEYGRSLDQFRFQLHDDHSSTYAELTPANSYGLDSFAALHGRRPLLANVTPRTVTHVFLVFDIATDAKPRDLEIFSRNVGTVLAYKLSK